LILPHLKVQMVVLYLLNQDKKNWIKARKDNNKLFKFKRKEVDRMLDYLFKSLKCNQFNNRFNQYNKNNNQNKKNNNFKQFSKNKLKLHNKY
jgi:response regulator of citrate/malate metabolism